MTKHLDPGCGDKPS